MCKSSGELQEGMSKHSNKTAQRKFLMTQKRLAVAMGVKAKDLPSGTQDRKHLDVQDILSRLGAAFDSIDWKSLQKVDPFALPTGPQFRDSKQDLEALRVSVSKNQSLGARKTELVARATKAAAEAQKQSSASEAAKTQRKKANHAKRQANGRKSNRIKRSDSDSDSEELQEDLGACEGFDKVKLCEIVALYNIKPREATENDEAWQKRIQAFPTSPWTLGVVIAKDTNIPDEDGDPCPVKDQAFWYDYGHEIFQVAIDLAQGETGTMLWTCIKRDMNSERVFLLPLHQLSAPDCWHVFTRSCILHQMKRL
eukprot:g41502.t1